MTRERVRLNPSTHYFSKNYKPIDKIFSYINCSLPLQSVLLGNIQECWNTLLLLRKSTLEAE